MELAIDGPGGLSGECDCPYGMEGNFCKHLVALGLTVLAQRESLPRQRKAARDRAQDLDGWLSGLSKAELLALVRFSEDYRAGREGLALPLILHLARLADDYALPHETEEALDPTELQAADAPDGALSGQMAFGFDLGDTDDGM